MVDKVNGKAMAGEFLGKNLDFYSVAITFSGASAALRQVAIEKCIETISINGQPIMLSGNALDASLANGTSRTLKFAIEHTGSWGQDAETGAKLVADRTFVAETELGAALLAIPGVSAAVVTLVDVL